jgi:mannan endo-1,4-beta-mannosidase
MVTAVGCSDAAGTGGTVDNQNEAPPAGAVNPSDTTATSATKALYQTLRNAGGQQASVLFGQQEADVANTSTNGLRPIKSDVEQLTGKLPAIISYELSNTYYSTTMFDPAGFRSGAPALRDLIVNNAKKGVFSSVVWHMRCPKDSTSKSDSYKPSECPSDYNLDELLEKTSKGQTGKHFEEWHAMLDELAEFLKSLKDERGEAVPVLFRPFHEFTGDWFWWGRTNNPEVYQKAWREMVSYLQSRDVHNVLWVFCPDKPTDEWQVRDGGDFRNFYPGDDYVDVVGFDRYDFNDGKFAAGYQADIDAISKFTQVHGKVAAVTEVGMNFRQYGVSANPTWFTKSMMAPLTTTDGGKGFSYVALWRNAPWEKYMAELSDGALADDFRAMSRDTNVVFSSTAGAPAAGAGEGTAAGGGGNSPPPKCVDPNSDPDGDGWGWENNQSCKVGA